MEMLRYVHWHLSTFPRIGMHLHLVSGQSKNIPWTCLHLQHQAFSLDLERSCRWQH